MKTRPVAAAPSRVDGGPSTLQRTPEARRTMRRTVFPLPQAARTRASALALAMGPCFARVVHAAEGVAAPGSDDYRARVYTAATLVFLCILLYLVGTHRRNARLRQEVDALRRRVEGLERQAP